jgi:hypothetical protein
MTRGADGGAAEETAVRLAAMIEATRMVLVFTVVSP